MYICKYTIYPVFYIDVMSPCLLTGEHNYHLLLLDDDQSLCFAALHWFLDVLGLFSPRNLCFLSPLVSLPPFF